MKGAYNKLNNKHLQAIGVVAISIVVSTMLIGSVTSYYLEKKIAQKLDTLHVRHTALNVSLLSRSITVNNLEWNSLPDSISQIPHHLFIKKFSARGIGLFKLLFHKQITIRELLLDEGFVTYNKKKKSTSNDGGKPIPGIDVDQLILKNIQTTMVSDSVIDGTMTLNLHLNAIHFSGRATAKDSIRYNFITNEITLDKFSFGKETGLYSISIRRMRYLSQKQEMIIDSAFLIPNYGKYEFANQLGRQETRVEIALPLTVISGLNLNHTADSCFLATTVKIHSADIKAFRDKRLPFKNGRVPLPMESLQKLKLAIEIDSIILKNAHVTNEEFASDGTAPGSVSFENLDAVFVGLTNRYYANKPRFATLYASALLMGKGKVDATFKLPVDGSAHYHAKGRISGIALHHINPILENLGHIRIETGQLNEMSFAFDYTDVKSNGSLQINYEDLKMTALNSDREATKNEFKTFLINTIIKNDKDEKTKRSKRTGKIDFERDQQKFIFNYWWKSVLSGIKSAVLGDRLEAQQEKLKDKKK